MRGGAMSPLRDGLLEAYLGALGVEPRRPGDELLAEITARHHARVPFENLTKLRLFAERPAGAARRPDDDRFVGQLAELGAGDTCFGIAHALGGLLGALGYRVFFVGARVGEGDDDAHVACVVEQRGHLLLVDCGFGAPLFEPVPLERDAGPRACGPSWSPHRFVAAPEDRFRLELRDDAGAWAPAYHLLMRPRAFEHFHAPIDRSFDPKRPSPFLSGLHAVRNEPERQVALRRDRLVVTRAGGAGGGPARQEQALASLEALVAAVAEHLDVAPAHTEAAARALREALNVDPFDPDRR
jgi:arylamine N-acetyltransferase